MHFVISSCKLIIVAIKSSRLNDLKRRSPQLAIAQEGFIVQSRMILIFLLIQTFVGVWSQSPACEFRSDAEHRHRVTCDSITDFTFITAYLNSSDLMPYSLNIVSSPDLVLKRDDFDGPMFRELNRLSYSSSNLINFNPQILIGLPNLTALYLNENNITSIPGGMFEGLSQLQILDLSDNYLTSISNESFANLSKLKKLILKRNSINRIDQGVFQSNINLISLDLQVNLLKSFDSRVLEGTKLKYLHLEGNNFDDISQVVLNMSTLEMLIMENCNIISLPLGFFNNVPNLRVIDLERNNLTTIPAGLFTPLPRLRFLNMPYNHLTSMNVDTFQQFYPIFQAPEETVDMTDIGEGSHVMQPRCSLDRNPWNCETTDMKQLRQWSEERGIIFNNIFQCEDED